MTIKRVLDLLSSTRFRNHMAILLTAIAGNLLAWLFHILCWWLRK
ncbi:MAG TPA: hypothetical protein VM821_06605 [Abditibacteriaceae bacterium]|nr:hypothetical protein [Abditibacteriaceae bacterium]